MQLKLAILIGVVGAQIPDLTGAGLVGSEGDAEFGTLDGVAGDAVDLIDRQGRLGIVLELDGSHPVREQRDQLMLLVEQVVVRYRLLPHLIDAGIKVLNIALAILIGGNGSQRGGIHLLHGEVDALHGSTGDGVRLDDLQSRLAVIGDDQFTDPTGEQLHMVLHGISHIALRCLHLLDGVDAGFQIGDIDLTVGIGHPIQVMRTILDLSNPEARTSQRLAVIAVQLDQTESRFPGVGEYEACILIAIDLDGARGIVDQVAIRGCQLRDGICTGLQSRQVDFTILIGNILFGEGAADQLNFEACVGLRFQRGRIQLHEVDSGLLIVEEDQLPDTISAAQLNLLGIGIDNVLVAGGDLLGKVGAGFQIHQQNLAEFISGEGANQLRILVDLKSHTR